MQTRIWIRISFALAIVALLLISYSAIIKSAEATILGSGWKLDTGIFSIHSGADNTFGKSPRLSSVQSKLLEDTSLSVSILSSPWAILDSNDPGGLHGQVPQVLVVEGTVTNTGATPAISVDITLDYNEDPGNNWVLLPGEDPERSIDFLAPGATYTAYWFVRYALVPNSLHLYTVYAQADNAPLASTSENFYGNPQPGYTVETISELSTGNSGIAALSSEIVVGVEFTATVTYDLGTNPLRLVFSPVGNSNFNPASVRLTSVNVLFYNDARTWEESVPDQLYFPTVDSRAENAQVTFTFLDLLAEDTYICPFVGVTYSSSQKYDQFYCDPTHGTILPFEGTLIFTMDKQASSSTIEQGQVVTYTIAYTNTGSLALSYVWVWDEINTTLGSVITPTISPPPDPVETNSSRVAWYLNQVPANGQPGSSGTLTFSVSVDGAGEDIADSTELLNIANFGINPSSLPHYPALTDSTSTIIQAPLINPTKTDGADSTEPGERHTYILRVSNGGSTSAESVVITDILPSDVTMLGQPTPPPDIQNGQEMTWTSLGSIPAGESLTIYIPVKVNIKTPNGTVLSNNMEVRYTNPAGHLYDTQTASDVTIVKAPLLAIGKSGFPDPVYVGQTILYTIDYANNGDGQATNTVITDTIPLNTTFQSCFGAPCSLSNEVVTWQLGTIPQNTNGTVSFTVLVDESLPEGSVIDNHDYGIISDQTNFKSGDPLSTQVRALADMSIEKSDYPDPVDAGGVLTYTLGLSNLGPSTAESIVITDEMPAEVTFSGIISQPPYLEGPTQLGQVLSWTTTSLASGEAGNIIYSVSVSADASTPLENSAVITSNTADLELGNNQVIEHTFISTPLLANIYGWVFEDLDGDGMKDLVESGIPDVVITLDGVTTTTTGMDGWYFFSTDVEGMHTLVETDPAGYTSTTPNEVEVVVSLGSNYRVDFGDLALCTCPPDSYEDDDVQADAKAILEGLWNIQERSFCDDASDWITLTAESGGVYTITTDSYGQRADTFLALYDVDGQTLLAANDDYLGGTDLSSQVVYETHEAGVYYINVTNRAGLVCCQTNYSVWVEAKSTAVKNYYLPISLMAPTNGLVELDRIQAGVPLGVISHLCPDSYEVDDTWEQAGMILPGELQLHSFDSNPLIYSADKDVFGFDADDNDVITFTIDTISNTQTLLELFDDHGDALGIVGTTQLVWIPAETGHYYLSVSPVTETFGCVGEAGYQIRLEQSTLVLPKVYLPLITKLPDR